MAAATPCLRATAASSKASSTLALFDPERGVKTLLEVYRADEGGLSFHGATSMWDKCSMGVHKEWASCQRPTATLSKAPFKMAFLPEIAMGGALSTTAPFSQET